MSNYEEKLKSDMQVVATAGAGDKRVVSTDALETLGMIHFKEEKRDAIHLAVDPVEAAMHLFAGQHIRIEDGKAYASPPNKSHGIVDPFLPRNPEPGQSDVQPGQKFWFVMKPRMVHSLRHVWTHPDFPEAE